LPNHITHGNGLNEHTNGLFIQYFPKGSNLSPQCILLTRRQAAQTRLIPIGLLQC
jgi:IS30 family transposase